jgi:hypothetical protein
MQGPRFNPQHHQRKGKGGKGEGKGKEKERSSNAIDYYIMKLSDYF